MMEIRFLAAKTAKKNESLIFKDDPISLFHPPPSSFYNTQTTYTFSSA